MLNDIVFNIEGIELNNECLYINGWAFSKLSDNFLKISLSDSHCKFECEQFFRNDVLQEYKEYIGAYKSGFSVKITYLGQNSVIKIMFQDQENLQNSLDYCIDIDELIINNGWNRLDKNKLFNEARKKLNDYVEDIGYAKKIIYLLHDAQLDETVYLALYTVKALKEVFKYNVTVIIKNGGALESDFTKYATVYNLAGDCLEKNQAERLIKDLNNSGYSIAICNTCGTVDLIELLYKFNIRIVTLVHEFPGILEAIRERKNTKTFVKYSHKIVFSTTSMHNRFNLLYDVSYKTLNLPQGSFNKNKYKKNTEKAKTLLRKTLGVSNDTKIVLGVGLTYEKKAIDYFISAAAKVIKTSEKVVFVWVGSVPTSFIDKQTKWLAINAKKRIIFVNDIGDKSYFYAGADLFLMTSEKDTFSTSLLDTMNVGVPVIGFLNAGSCSDIVTKDTGILVKKGATNAMADRVGYLLAEDAIRKDMGSKAMKLVEEKFNFNSYIFNLLNLLGHNYKKVSVVVPNYNYAIFLEDRLKSIIKQKYPIHDIVILDDNSNDNSVGIINNFVEKYDCINNITFLRNFNNSGSVFEQWKKGVLHSKGDFIWMAEADDLCKTDFLEKVLGSMKTEDIILGYTQSKQINSSDIIFEENYLKYTNDIDLNKWKENYINNGIAEIEQALAVKNTIPNVSAVVFKKPDELSIFDKLCKFEVAGDWFFYIWLLQNGNISFIAEALNYHRRHISSVSGSQNRESLTNEVVSIQDYVMASFNVNDKTKRIVYEYRDKMKNVNGVQL